MTTFNEFYHNRDDYKEYISSHITYLLNLSYAIPVTYYDISGADDKLTTILALAAIKELNNQEIFNFYYIITDPRFNDECSKELLKMFFKQNIKDSKQNTFVNEVFQELLDENFFNFSYIFKNNERENYCGYVKENKDKLTMLIKSLSEKEIYFYSLYNFLNGTKNKKISSYIKQCKKQEYVYEIMHGERDYAHLSTREYVGEYLDKKEKEKCLIVHDKISTLEEELKKKGSKNKSEIALKIIATGLSFPYKAIIGSKKNYIKSKNEITYYPDTPYYEKYPLCFNNPVKNMKECIDSLSHATDTHFTEKEKIQIYNVFEDIYYLIYEEEDNEKI